MKKYFKFLSAFLCVVFLAVSLSSYSRAVPSGESVSIKACRVTEKAYEPAKHFWELDIRRTVHNFLISTIVSLYTNLAGVDPDTTMSCQSYIFDIMKSKYPENIYNPDSQDALNEEFCMISDEDKKKIEPVCQALVSDLGAGGNNSSPTTSMYMDSVNSSLIGFGTLLEGAARKEPLPVNLAYYWNQSVEKIPFAGRALAADGDAYENLPVIKAVYQIWTISLRISLGLLSVVLLYTGIMITMRKKVSSQLVVSVQYAIPKIVIGTILIIFSYPIGAVITSIAFGLFRGSFDIVFNILMGGEGAPSGILLLAMMIRTLGMARGGGWYLIVTIVMLLILVVAKWIIYLKVLMVYLKMAFSIVSAPVEFALGAIPGNDDKMRDWFLRMAKYGLTIFGMGLAIPLTLVVGLDIMAAYGGGAGEVGGWGRAISLIAPLLVVVFGFGIGMGMEKRVDEMFGGAGAKKKK